jgi:hypothetical protein
VTWVPENLDGIALLRIDGRQRPREQRGNAQHGDVVVPVDHERVGDVAVHGNPVPPGHDVRGRDDKVRTHDPAASLDAEPAGRRSDAHDALAQRGHIGRSKHVRRDRDVGQREPADLRERVDARERPQDGARRHGRVQPLQNHGLLDLLVQVRQAGHPVRQLQGRRAGNPDDREPEDRSGDEPAERVEQTERRDHPDALARDRADEVRNRLQDDRADDRAAQADQRRVRRRRAAVQDVRRGP